MRRVANCYIRLLYYYLLLGRTFRGRLVVHEVEPFPVSWAELCAAAERVGSEVCFARGYTVNVFYIYGRICSSVDRLFHFKSFIHSFILFRSEQQEPPQPFYGPFFGTTRVSRCQKRTSGLCGAGED